VRYILPDLPLNVEYAHKKTSDRVAIGRLRTQTNKEPEVQRYSAKLPYGTANTPKIRKFRVARLFHSISCIPVQLLPLSRFERCLHGLFQGRWLPNLQSTTRRRTERDDYVRKECSYSKYQDGHQQGKHKPYDGITSSLGFSSPYSENYASNDK